MAMNNSQRKNRTLLSTALLTLATLVVNVDNAAVLAFKPSSSGKASLSTGPISSSINGNNNINDFAVTKISPLSTKRRRQRQRRHGRQQIGGSIVSAFVNDDLTATATFDGSISITSAQVASDHGVSIMTSPILDQQRISRLSPNVSKKVVVFDDEVLLNNNKRNDIPVHLHLENENVGTPSQSKMGRLISTNVERNHIPSIVHDKKSDNPAVNKSSLKSSTKKKSISSLDSSSTSLLTRDEERLITYKIRNLRRVVLVRDAMLRQNADSSLSDDHREFPTEEEWAESCDLDVSSLRRIMSEGQDARSVLVSANAGLVKTIAKRHYYVLKQMTTAGGGVGTILTLQDMIQEGNLGLMKAAERFEPERGFRFSTYATYWIRQRILQSITDSSRVIRLPVHVTDTLKKLNKARKEMSAEIGRMPSDAELAHHMNISVEKLRRISDKARSVVSLESPLRTSNDHRSEIDHRTIGDFIASDAPTPEEDAEHKSLQRDIRAVVNELAEREREVLILRFGLDNGEPMSTSETAAQLGITTDRVRHMETRALNKLRNPQRNYRLKDYLGEGHHASIKENQKGTLPKPHAATDNSASISSSFGRKQKKSLAHGKFWFF